VTAKKTRRSSGGKKKTDATPAENPAAPSQENAAE
jgi:hypothetical protein